MKNMNLLLIAIIILSSAYLISFLKQPTPDSDSKIGKPLVSIDEIEQTAEIIYEFKEGKHLLKKSASKWLLTNKNSFPVNHERIEELFQNLLAAKPAEMVTSNPKRLADLALEEQEEVTNSDTLILTLIDKNEMPIKKIYFGKNRITGSADDFMGYAPSGQYVRFADSNKAYLVQNSIWVEQAQARWLKKNLYSSTQDNIKSVSWFKNNEEEFNINRDTATESFVLSNLPPDKQTVASKSDSATHFFGTITFDELIESSHLTTEAFNNNRTIKISTFDNFQLSLKIAQPEPVQEENEEKKEPEKSDFVLLASYEGSDIELKEKADEINRLAEHFYFQMQTSRIKPLLIGFDELIEDIPPTEETTGEAPKTEGTEPQKITASHILIPWKDAERSSSELTKQEAKEQIEEILEKIKNGDSFEDLAEKFSACPSGKSNKGSLGEFGKGAMTKDFEVTAFNLNPGEISDIVETEFGFHIIRRDK